jgi:uncharacterized membrane protein
VIHTVVRILAEWIGCMKATGSDVEFDRVTMTPISPEALLTDAFRPIARDGSGNVEVCLKLLEALEGIRALSPERFEKPVRRFASDLLDRVDDNMTHGADRAAVRCAGLGLTSRQS